MASTLTLSSNFAGVAATDYISASLFEGKTLAGGYLTIIPNIKDAFNIVKYDVGDNIQAYAADFNAAGTHTWAEVVLTPTNLMVNYELPVKQFEQTWEATKMIPGAFNSNASTSLQAYIISEMNKATAQEVEYNLWRGNFTGATSELSGYTKFTGILRTLDTNSPNRVAGTTLSSSNIITEIAKVYDSLVANCSNVGIDNYKIYISNAAAGLYKAKIASVSLEASFVGDRQLNYLGVELVPVPGMPTNIMASFASKNVFFGTDLLNDSNSIHLIDMRETTLDYKVRYRCDFKAGVQVGYGAETVLYKA